MMRKRFSGRRPLLLVGTIAASTLVLAACSESPPQDIVYSSAEQCIQGGVDPEVCNTAYADAMQAHLVNAPKFDGKAACEAEFGPEQCAVQPAQAGQTGSFWGPFMTGYLVSTAFNNIGDYNRYRNGQEQYAGGGYYAPTPIYRNRTGQNVSYTAPRSTPVSTPGSTSRPPSVSAPSRPTVVAAPVNVNTTTVARGGFGGKSTSFGG